jgi:hypothetical protein
LNQLKEVTPESGEKAETSQNKSASLSSILRAEGEPGEDIENQVVSMAGLLAPDAEYEIPDYTRDSEDDYSLRELHLDESGWENQNDAMAISSDDHAIIENLPPIRRPKKKFTSRKSGKAHSVKRKRTVAQEVELSESDSETDPETCSK